MTTTLMDVDVDKILRVYFLCQRDIRKLKEHRGDPVLSGFFVSISLCFLSHSFCS